MVATPDGVWHRDSHYRRKFIGGVHKIQILIMDKLEDFVNEFLWIFHCSFEISRSGWSPPPMGFGIGIFSTGGNL